MDEVLAALGAFLGELKPRDWITAGIAAVALFVSWRAFVRAGKVIPRARFRVIWPPKLDPKSVNGVVLVTIELENFGGDAARHFRARIGTLKSEGGIFLEMPFVEPSGEQGGWSSTIPLQNATKSPQWKHTEDNPKIRRPWVVVRWRRENTSWLWRWKLSRAPKYDENGARVDLGPGDAYDSGTSKFVH